MKEYIVHVEDDEMAYEEYFVGYIRHQKELIRCKDCARNPNNGTARTICPCPMDRYMGDEGYCSKAEPKETT